MRILRCALATSNVSCIICCWAICKGAQARTSEIRGNIMWLGMMVLEVTLLMELSTTKRGDLPSARTTPSFPTAVRLYDARSSERPPGTSSMKPACSSSATSWSTISGWSWALFHESLHWSSGSGSATVPAWVGHAGDGVSV